MINKQKIFFSFILIIFLAGGWHHLPGQRVHEFMDLQIHPTTHVPYPFFSKGLKYFSKSYPPELSYKHLFNNVNYANYWEDNPGCRIFVVGALNPEVSWSKGQARRSVLKQIKYVDEFVANNSEHFAVARNPEEVRKLVHETEKTIIIHSIEGAKKIVDGPEDAKFWADQGVAFITLIHLMDDENGGAAIKPEFNTKLINWKGSLKKAFKKHDLRGLSEKGKQTIRWLADAGIMIDLSHMSDQSRSDALDLMLAEGIPAISTHDGFKPIQNRPRAIPERDVRRIYESGGFIGLPISGYSLLPYEAHQKIQDELNHDSCHCVGSVDSYLFTYEKVKSFVEAIPGSSFDSLSESTKTDFSIGFQSDFNGWLNHSRPRVGPEGCDNIDFEKDYEAIELFGLEHPGLLQSQWDYMEKQGADLEPIKRSSEKFIQLWEKFLQRKD